MKLNMKKTILIILYQTIIFALFVFSFIPKVNYAIPYTDVKILSSYELATIKDIDPDSYRPNGDVDQDVITSKFGGLYNLIFSISIIISVITLSIIGVKFIVGSASEKAGYKEHLWPILIGILLISFLATILSALMKLAGSI